MRILTTILVGLLLTGCLHYRTEVSHEIKDGRWECIREKTRDSTLGLPVLGSDTLHCTFPDAYRECLGKKDAADCQKRLE